MNRNLMLVAAAVIIIIGIVYYQQHTHTASLELPGGKAVSVTTHD